MTLANLASQAPVAYDLLQRIGLQRRRQRATRVAARAGWLGAGIALGGGLALLFSPRSGAELRESLGEQAKRARDYVAPPREESDGKSHGRAPSTAGAASRL